MKTTRNIVTIGLLTVLMSCGTSGNKGKEMNSDVNASSTTVQDMDRMDGNDTDVNYRDTNNGNDAMDGVAFDTDYDKERMQRMYTDLNMTQDQIERYETQNRTAMDSWKSKNSQKAMNMRERMQHQDKTLKGILDQDQYTQYQQWSKDNPYKN